jgi:hypothetical protein
MSRIVDHARENAALVPAGVPKILSKLMITSVPFGNLPDVSNRNAESIADVDAKPRHAVTIRFATEGAEFLNDGLGAHGTPQRTIHGLFSINPPILTIERRMHWKWG